jgi:hypothetical protein
MEVFESLHGELALTKLLWLTSKLVLVLSILDASNAESGDSGVRGVRPGVRGLPTEEGNGEENDDDDDDEDDVDNDQVESRE